MNIWSINGRSTEGFSNARIHRDICTTNGFENAAGVGRGVLQRCIAMDCRDTQEFQRWVVSGNENRKRILLDAESYGLGINTRLDRVDG